MNIDSVQTSEPKTRRGYRLFKRDDKGRILQPDAPGYRERPYHFRFQFRGKSYARCLDTNDAAKAQKFAAAKAREIKDSTVTQDYARLAATKNRADTTATVAQLCEVYRTAPGDASTDSRQQYINALHQFLRVAAGQDADVGALSVSRINGDLARAWFSAATARAAAAQSQTAEASIKRSANSRYVHASSLFTPRAIAAYQAAGVDHPAFADFLKVGALNLFTRLPKDHYNPPPEEVIRATLEAWTALEDRNLFLAIGHELAFGLRAGELSQARWSWWAEREGYPVLDGTANVKSGTGWVQVRALDPWFSTMQAKVQARGWRGQPDDFIITGNKTFRCEGILDAVGAWLKAFGWKTRKTNHALRAYSGSQVAMRYGIYEAQVWLRHSTVKVTERHYSYFIKRFRPADVSTIPAKWATAAPQTPLLRVLDAPATETIPSAAALN